MSPRASRTSIPGGTPPEAAFVGECLVDPRQIDRFATDVKPEHFLDAGLGQLWGALVTLRDAGKPVDRGEWLIAELPRMGVPAETCSVSSLGRLIADAGGGAFGMPAFAQSIVRSAELRRIHVAALRVAERAREPDADPADLRQSLEEAAAEDATSIGAEVVHIADAERQALVSAREARGRPGGRVFTGIADLDAVLGPFCAGEVVVGAKTGQGKTSLASQMAHRAALSGLSVLVVSLEMQAREIGARRLAARTGVSSQALRAGKFSDDEDRRLAAAVDDMDDPELRFHLWAPASTTMRQLRAVAKRTKARHGLDALFVDYLQLVEGDSQRTERYLQVQEVSRGLKRLAGELGTVVFALSQFSRKADETDERPRLSWLRESGSIEQDADAVLLIHHEPTEAESTSELRRAEIVVEKCRFGERAAVLVAWRPSKQRFEDAPPDWINDQPAAPAPRRRKRP